MAENDPNDNQAPPPPPEPGWTWQPPPPAPEPPPAYPPPPPNYSQQGYPPPQQQQWAPPPGYAPQQPAPPPGYGGYPSPPAGYGQNPYGVQPPPQYPGMSAPAARKGPPLGWGYGLGIFSILVAWCCWILALPASVIGAVISYSAMQEEKRTEGAASWRPMLALAICLLGVVLAILFAALNIYMTLAHPEIIENLTKMFQGR